MVSSKFLVQDDIELEVVGEEDTIFVVQRVKNRLFSFKQFVSFQSIQKLLQK